MTNGAPQRPDESAPDTASVASGPTAPSAPPADPSKGTGFGIVAVVLGGLGCVLSLVPFDLADARAWLPLPFALPGLAIGIIGCAGPRRGNTWAIAGSILCVIAVGLSAVMLIGSRRDGTETSGPGHTQEILRDELDVRLGEWRVDPENGTVHTTVTLYNKGPFLASYVVTFDVDRTDDEPCDDVVSAHDLAPGGSYQTEIGTCGTRTDAADVSFQVTNASKNPY